MQKPSHRSLSILLDISQDHDNLDENWKASTKDPLQVPIGPITRARAKKFKEAPNGLIQGLWADSNCKMESNKNLRILNLIQADGGPSQT